MSNSPEGDESFSSSTCERSPKLVVKRGRPRRHTIDLTRERIKSNLKACELKASEKSPKKPKTRSLTKLSLRNSTKSSPRTQLNAALSNLTIRSQTKSASGSQTKSPRSLIKAPTSKVGRPPKSRKNLFNTTNDEDPMEVKSPSAFYSRFFK